MKLEGETIIAETLATWPQTMYVFNRLGMACVGCAMAPFENLNEAAELYGLSPAALLDELHHAIDACSGES